MLCMVLTLAFAGAAQSSMQDHFRHLPGVEIAHEHGLLSELTVQPEADHHDASGQRDGRSADPVAGHHHHSDSGSGMPAQAGLEPIKFAPGLGLFVREAEARLRGLGTTGQERPPKLADMSA